MRHTPPAVALLALLVATSAAAQTSGYFTNVRPITELNQPATSNHFSCALDEDELYIVFASDRPGGQGGFDLYEATRPNVAAKWNTPVALAQLNSASAEYEPFVTRDGLELYFVSMRPGGFTTSDVWMATRASRSAPWGKPQNVGSAVNVAPADDPHVTADGLTMFFTSTGAGYDVFTATRTAVGQPWGNRQPLSYVNTAAGDHSPAPEVPGRILWFGSDRAGGAGSSDLWLSWFDLAANAWVTPVNVAELNTTAWDSNLWRSGRTGRVYWTSYGNGGVGALYVADPVLEVGHVSRSGATDAVLTPLPAFTPPRAMWSRVWPASIARGGLVLEWFAPSPGLQKFVGFAVAQGPGFGLAPFVGRWVLHPSAVLLGGFPNPADGLHALGLAIPADPSLQGQLVHVQAIALDPLALRGAFAEPLVLRFVP